MSDGIQSYVVSVSTIDKNESAILQSIIDYDTVINSKEVTNPTIRTLAENAKQILNVKNKLGPIQIKTGNQYKYVLTDRLLEM